MSTDPGLSALGESAAKLLELRTMTAVAGMRPEKLLREGQSVNRAVGDLPAVAEFLRTTHRSARAAGSSPAQLAARQAALLPRFAARHCNGEAAPRDVLGLVEARIAGDVLREGDAPAMAAPRKYPEELAELAVRLVFEPGRPIAHVAQDPGLRKEALRTWVRQARGSGRAA